MGCLQAELAGDEVTALAEVIPLADPVTALLDIDVASPDVDEPSLVVGVASLVAGVASLVPALPVLAESVEFGVAGPVFSSVPAAVLSG